MTQSNSRHIIAIDNHPIGADHPCFVIAEIGSNHNQDLNVVKKIIDAAVRAGADAVKFQSFSIDNWLSDDFTQFPTISEKKNLKKILKKAELPNEMYELIVEYCKKKDIICFSTPSHKRDVDQLGEFKTPAFKFGSVQITDIPTITYAASFGIPIILSGGASNMSEILQAIEAVRKTGNDQISLLHCTSLYPSDDFSLLNLNVMDSYRVLFDFPIGYSDHTTNPIIMPVAAVAKGAKIIEKHITLDRTMEGPDHRFALNPSEFKQMIRAIRLTEQSLGSTYQNLSSPEREIAYWGRRSLVSKRSLKCGERITVDDITIKRPGYGIAPQYLDLVLNKILCKDAQADHVLTWDMFLRNED